MCDLRGFVPQAQYLRGLAEKTYCPEYDEVKAISQEYIRLWDTIWDLSGALMGAGNNDFCEAAQELAEVTAFFHLSGARVPSTDKEKAETVKNYNDKVGEFILFLDDLIKNPGSYAHPYENNLTIIACYCDECSEYRKGDHPVCLFVSGGQGAKKEGK